MAAGSVSKLHHRAMEITGKDIVAAQVSTFFVIYKIRVTQSSPRTPLFLAAKVPFEDAAEGLFSVAHQRLSVARNERVKVPVVDSLDALIETVPVPCAQDVPQESLHALCVPLGRLHVHKQLTRETNLFLALRTLRVLLISRQVEHKIGLDHDPLGLV